MNLAEERYARFALVREMIETARVVRGLDLRAIEAFGRYLPGRRRAFLTGEGSSRIFPGKLACSNALKFGLRAPVLTEAATQAREYDLRDATVFVASNSGRTKEAVGLIRALRSKGHRAIVGVVANGGTPVDRESDARYLLSCGPENAVAATKSVVEQALFYDLLLRTRHRRPMPDLDRLAEALQAAMEAPVPEATARALSSAETIYWAGRNNGVAEELTLKTNEIARKRSDFLEGTYAVHGIEEVMRTGDALVVVDPFPEEEEKLHEVVEAGAGLPVFALGGRASRFPGIPTADCGDFTPYVQLVAGWNLLVEIGLRLGIDVDRPERARKVGNELKG